MANLMFWFHVGISVAFFLVLVFVFYKNFVKKNQNTTLVKIKFALVLFIWSFFSFLGILLLFPKGSENNLQEMCGMFWLAEIVVFFIIVILEIIFLIIGFVLLFLVKNLSYSNEPLSIFEENK